MLKLLSGSIDKSISKIINWENIVPNLIQFISNTNDINYLVDFFT
jgi:hypothetical protein